MEFQSIVILVVFVVMWLILQLWGRLFDKL